MKKVLHLFGCSFPALNTDEECLEESTCLKCGETNIENSENKT